MISNKLINRGAFIELEHAKTIKKYSKNKVKVWTVARNIARDHLKEDLKYYSKLRKIERRKK